MAIPACYKGDDSYKVNSDNDVMQDARRRNRYLGSRSGKSKRLYGTYVRHTHCVKATLQYYPQRDPLAYLSLTSIPCFYDLPLHVFVPFHRMVSVML